MSEGKFSRRHSSTEMFPLVEAFQKGDLGRAAFCAQHGLNMPVLDYWRKRYREREQSSFVPIEISGGAEAVLELGCPSGHHLRFSRLPDVGYLRALLGKAK